MRDASIKDQFTQMFFKPENISETQKMVRNLSETFIKKFEGFNTTFTKPDDLFIRELTQHVRDAISSYLSNSDNNEASKQQFIQKMKKKLLVCQIT